MISSRINCVAYVPSHKGRRTGSSLKHRHQQHKQEDEEQQSQNKHSVPAKQEASSIAKNSDTPTTVDSLLDIDSSDEEDTSTTINNDEIFSMDQTIPLQQYILLESDVNTEPQDTREATMWLGTDDGV